MLAQKRLDLRLSMMENVTEENEVRGHRKRWQAVLPMEHKSVIQRRITIRCTRSRGPRGFFCLQVFRRGPVNVAVIPLKLMLETLPIERRVMSMLLAGDHPTLDALRQQFERSYVVDRDLSGVGFFTTFEVRDASARIEPATRIVIGDVCGDVDGLEYGCGFLLFVDDGLLGTLECHLWGDSAFPENPRYNRLYYIHQPTPPGITETTHRDMESVIAMLAG